MARKAKRDHYIAQFYLRNFAEPMFSNNLCVYNLKKQHWDRRTPKGIGWFPHLYSMFDTEGNRTDSFEKFLGQQVEDPAAPAFKKLATGAGLEPNERSAAALFIALTAARSPEMMSDIVTGHLNKLATPDREGLDELVKLWCGWIGKPYDSKSHNEFLKPSSFGAIWIWSKSLQHRLLESEWHLIQTTREQPFITSDRPVFAQWDRQQDVRLVSFPVSSEFALIVTTGGEFNEGRDRSKEVLMVNQQTMARATEFVVACKEEFPSDKLLAMQAKRAMRGSLEMDAELLANIQAKFPELAELLKEISSHWVYEDRVYRFYHQSYKVYDIQDHTKRIVEALRSVAPSGASVNPWFEEIYQAGVAGKRFEMEHNKDWTTHTRPFIEAFFHAKFFLEMAVKYGKELKEAPSTLPSGWAALLYFYNIR